MLLTTFSEPTENVYHVQENTQAFIQDKYLGKGTLYITEDYLSWCDLATGKGFSLDYPVISLHAVCKDTAYFPHECLFCMVEEAFEDEMESGSDNGSEDDHPATELRFVPDDKMSLERIYIAISDCQVLHPDQQEQLEEEMAGYPLDYGEEFFTSQNDENADLTEDGQATLDRLENVFQLQSQQEFLEMTQQTNGGVNGHDATESGQFDDVED